MAKNNYVYNNADFDYNYDNEGNITEYCKLTTLIGDELLNGVEYETLWASVYLANNSQELLVALDAKDWLDELVHNHNE
tara:strand:+ start:224 stop:460 length:237 start_codon:yes stop_codon:yes gene_type:complete